LSYIQNRARPLEQFFVRLSANNDSFDKVLTQMFRVDPYSHTVRTLDLSMRFFKHNKKGMQLTPSQGGRTSLGGIKDLIAPLP